ncbi:unnamed protein product [Colias eurytheme]|nr:unnamed protein product [Colias eurytheme]
MSSKDNVNMSEPGSGGEIEAPNSQILINKVSIRVPPFWPDRPALWFATLEAQFHLNGITQELTKYYYAISQLDPKSAAEVEDIIITPPKDKPYSTIKNVLTSRFSESYEEKVRRLLEKEDIGDRKPSSFLRHLKSLAGTAFPEPLLKTIWMSRLPPHIQGILTAQNLQCPEDLGELADKLQEISCKPTQINAVSRNNTDNDMREEIKVLTQQVAELTRIVGSLSTSRGRVNQRESNQTRRHSRSHSRSRNLCWYHNRFKTKATKCIKPCSWVPSSQENSNSADVGTPIIGSDFLAHYSLLPDCAHGRLRDDATGLITKTDISSLDQPSIKFIQSPESPFKHILTDFPNITRPPGPPKQPKHSTVHFITTTDGPPISSRSRRLAPQKLRAAQREFEEMHATIYTDHKPLVYAFAQRRDKLPPTQLNQLTFISQFTTDIRYIKGADNVVADAMSRIETISLEDDYQTLAASQEGRPRPYLTLPFRKPTFDRLHNLSHPGIKATTRLVAERYVWPHINRDCRKWAQTCLECQRSKVTRHIHSPLVPFKNPSGRFRSIHIDIIGPLSYSNGFNYCLTAVDRYTRWPEAWPMSSITAEEVADTFVTGWISRFGVPCTVTTDQGRQFESALFRRLMNVCGAKRVRTTSYHPCANGMVERMHRQLKSALMCHAQTWSKALPVVLLGMRSALKEDLNVSSAELVYGEPLRLPGELVIQAEERRSPNDVADFVSDLRSQMEILRPIPASNHAHKQSFIFKDLSETTHVLLRDDTVRRPLQAPYTGPYQIIKRRDKTLTLDINGKHTTVSVDRIKPAHIDSEGTPFSTVPRPNNSNTNHIALSPTPITLNCETQSPSAPVTTRSGRRVRFRNMLDL